MEKMETEYGLVRVGRGKRSELQHIHTKYSDFLHQKALIIVYFYRNKRFMMRKFTT